MCSHRTTSGRLSPRLVVHFGSKTTRRVVHSTPGPAALSGASKAARSARDAPAIRRDIVPHVPGLHQPHGGPSWGSTSHPHMAAALPHTPAHDTCTAQRHDAAVATSDERRVT